LVGRGVRLAVAEGTTAICETVVAVRVGVSLGGTLVAVFVVEGVTVEVKVAVSVGTLVAVSVGARLGCAVLVAVGSGVSVALG
jgi:hypothetical protein